MKNRISEFGFLLFDIQSVHFEIIGEPDNSTEISLQANLDWEIDPAAGTIQARIALHFICGEEWRLEIVVQAIFELELRSWNAAKLEDGSSWEFPREFLATLGIITIGAARGILVEKTNVLPGGYFLLPVLDVSRLLKDTVVLSAKK